MNEEGIPTVQPASISALGDFLISNVAVPPMQPSVTQAWRPQTAFVSFTKGQTRIRQILSRRICISYGIILKGSGGSLALFYTTHGRRTNPESFPTKLKVGLASSGGPFDESTRGLTIADLETLKQSLQFLSDILRQSGVGALPLLPSSRSGRHGVDVAVPSEAQLIVDTTNAVTALYDRLKRKQDGSAVVAGLLTAPEHGQRAGLGHDIRASLKILGLPSLKQTTTSYDSIAAVVDENEQGTGEIIRVTVLVDVRTQPSMKFFLLICLFDTRDDPRWVNEPNLYHTCRFLR
ncbi:hypothetical protein IMY05_C4639000100 [Salix suchowensis]|nr:hypothetical protein IMY05_C4639000100 [Salix suchowensis]